MTQNSLILTEWGNYNGGSSNAIKLESHGCSEFIGINSSVVRSASLALNMLIGEDKTFLTKVGKIDKTYDLLTLMLDWVRLILRTFDCLNIIAGKPFFTPYTWGMLKADLARSANTLSPGLAIITSNNTISNGAGQVYTMTDDMIIGIQVDTVAMRKHFGHKYWAGKEYYIPTGASGSDLERCRKIQLPHTALRYGWSNAHDIALVMMKLVKMDPSLDPFYAIQIASYLRGKISGNWNADYGVLCPTENQIVSKDMFMSIYMDRTKNGVMMHFNKTSDSLVTMLMESAQSAPGSLKTTAKTIDHILNEVDKDLPAKIALLVDAVIGDKGLSDLKVKFRFKATIFRTTVNKMPYDGYRKKGFKIDRILFKDEEGTILSVAEKSKIIEII